MLAGKETPACPGPDPGTRIARPRTDVTARPTPADLAAATERTIPDLIGPDLDVLFVGINPGLYSGATGFHFARPGNRFWKAICGAGFTERVLDPSEQDELPGYGIGITNLVARTTATAAELSTDELRAGARILIDKVERWRPAVGRLPGHLDLSGRLRAAEGCHRASAHRLADSVVWVLPNPSGLNASWQLPRLVCGKTESARQQAASEVLLDVDASARLAVDIDPSLVLEGPSPRLIDEWQIEPALWNHIRRAVDDRRSPGAFILTGSAVPADDVTRHTGAGRISRLRMRPMSLFESGDATGAISSRAALGGDGSKSRVTPRSRRPCRPDLTRRLARISTAHRDAKPACCA